MNDSELLELIDRDAQSGMSALVEQYSAFVYVISRSKLESVCTPQDIEEFTSDIFYEFYQHRDRIDLERGSVKAFLSVLTKCRAINRYKNEMTRKSRRQRGAGEIPEELPAAVCTELDYEKREQANELIAQVKALGEPDGSIVICRYYLGMKSAEIARRFSLKENTVNKKITRALDKLRKSMGGVQNGEK